MRHKALLPPWRGGDHPQVRWPLGRPLRDPLTWEIQSRGPLTVVVIDGELDLSTATSLDRHVVPLADAGRHLILDLAGVRFCDCAGLSLFLRLHKHATAVGGSLHLAAPTARVRRLIAMARLSDVLPITSSAADVIAALDKAASSGPPLPRAENDYVTSPCEYGSSL